MDFNRNIKKLEANLARYHAARLWKKFSFILYPIYCTQIFAQLILNVFPSGNSHFSRKSILIFDDSLKSVTICEKKQKSSSNFVTI